jgi:hypothetical protein
VKVLTAYATQQNKDGQMVELQVMEMIRWLGHITSRVDEDEYYDDTDNEDVEGYDVRQLPQLLDQFEVNGPHGDHLCIVMNIYGTDVNTFRHSAPGNKLPLHTVKIITGLVLPPLTNLHSANIIHTRLFPFQF